MLVFFKDSDTVDIKRRNRASFKLHRSWSQGNSETSPMRNVSIFKVEKN